MKKKYFILTAIIISVMFIFTGCRFYFSGPQLSFNSYEIQEEEITEEVQIDTNDDGEYDTTETQIVGYKYTLLASVRNDGGPGQYSVELHGKETSSSSYSLVGRYGPVNIDTGDNSLSVVFNSETKYSNFKIKLYVDGQVVKVVEYVVNI